MVFDDEINRQHKKFRDLAYVYLARLFNENVDLMNEFKIVWM